MKENSKIICINIRIIISHYREMIVEQATEWNRAQSEEESTKMSQENGYATFVVVTVIVGSGVRFVIFVIWSGDDRLSQIKMNSNFTIILIIWAAAVSVLEVEMVKIRPTGYKSPWWATTWTWMKTMICYCSAVVVSTTIYGNSPPSSWKKW